MNTTAVKIVFASAMLFTAASCNESTEDRMENSADSIGTEIESGFADVKDDFEDYRDETFVDNILEENAEVLYLLQLAGTKGTAAYVKDASVNMTKHHKAIQDDFTTYAQQHNLETDIDDYSDNLATKESGAEWDEEWNRQVTNKHEKLINKFERKADNENNPDLQQIVNNHLPVLRQHLGTLGQYEH
jgi:putative membrane protein